MKDVYENPNKYIGEDVLSRNEKVYSIQEALNKTEEAYAFPKQNTRILCRLPCQRLYVPIDSFPEDDQEHVQQTAIQYHILQK